MLQDGAYLIPRTYLKKLSSLNRGHVSISSHEHKHLFISDTPLETLKQNNL